MAIIRPVSRITTAASFRDITFQLFDIRKAEGGFMHKSRLASQKHPSQREDVGEKREDWRMLIHPQS